MKYLKAKSTTAGTFYEVHEDPEDFPLTDTLAKLKIPEQTKELTGWSSDYYKIPEGAKELMDLIEHRGMNYAIGNIFKACYRLGAKTGTSKRYDLEKILWMAQRELDYIDRHDK